MRENLETRKNRKPIHANNVRKDGCKMIWDKPRVRKIFIVKMENLFSQKNYEMFKQVGLVGFTSKSIQKFAKSEQTDLELTEGVELLRAIEIDLKLYGVMLNYENRSVDTPEDLEFVRNKILDDELFLKYKKNETH